MRLIEPDIGEVLDRMAILQLKLHVGMYKNVPTASWEEELRQLDKYLEKKMQNYQRTATSFSNDQFSSANSRLNIVNAKLWEAEDEIRKYRKSSDLTDAEKAEVCLIALRIADLNDVRAVLVNELNQMFGAAAEDKMYVE